jgi:rubrerythrin
MANTTDNLKAAFAGESQANRKYLAFAKKADEDGFPGIAKLFRAAAAAETVHAHSHLRVLGEVKSTADNLQAASGGEYYEFTQMYPGFIEIGNKEGNKAAVQSFDRANQVEQIHHKLYKEAAASLSENKDIKAGTWYVCQVCGNTVFGVAPEECPICGAVKKAFSAVE